MKRIAIDVMGSDLGMEEVIRGATAVSMESDNQIQMLLVGDAKQIHRALIGTCLSSQVHRDCPYP